MTTIPDTSVQWLPTEEQRTVAELLATGHSQNRASALTGVAQKTIWHWWNDLGFSPQFREMVAEMAVQFGQRRNQVHDQQVALAQLLVQQGLTGERPGDDPQLLLAVEFLRNTDWKQRTGGHKQFGT